MNEEIKETAKATQEIAKTAKSAIEATEKLGRFVGNLVSESLEEIVGILTDKLKFIRWERQVRLSDKIKEIIEKRGLNQFRVIPPKFALPLIEAASIEENDELQDLWAKLLVTSIDPSKEFPRQGFIDILKQLEAIDVKILKIIYDFYKNHRDMEGYELVYNINNPTNITVGTDLIRRDILKIDEKIFYTSLDNLMRMRLITSHVPTVLQDKESYDVTSYSSLAGYEIVAITSMGLSFVEACMKE